MPACSSGFACEVVAAGPTAHTTTHRMRHRATSPPAPSECAASVSTKAAPIASPPPSARFGSTRSGRAPFLGIMLLPTMLACLSSQIPDRTAELFRRAAWVGASLRASHEGLLRPRVARARAATQAARHIQRSSGISPHRLWHFSMTSCTPPRFSLCTRIFISSKCPCLHHTRHRTGLRRMNRSMA